MVLLKYISTPELDFSQSFKNGLIKINRLNFFEKYMLFFWLAGPFIFLIERSPADIWLTLICIVFLGRCIYRNDWRWAFQLWFKLAMLLWGFGLFSAIVGTDPVFSFLQGFSWIRFPLYAAAAQAWLARDRDIRIIMLTYILIGMIIMSFILILETLIEPKLRLTWPYGDTVPGGYIAKFSLPLFCALVAVAVSKKTKAGFFSGIIALLTVGITALTGERGNLIIRACSGMLSSLVWKPKFSLVLLLIFIKITALILLALARPDLGQRFNKHFFEHIPFFNTNDKNTYWGAWRGGIQQGLTTPFIGIGPSGTRKTCKNLDEKLFPNLPGKNYCGNHPHNFYIQLFAETGFIGLLIGTTMFGSIIVTCYRARAENRNCPMVSTAFVVPLAFFFPIQQFGSFYGQWGNLFTWFAIAFAISQYQKWDNY